MSQVGALNTGTYLQETLPNYIQGQIYNTDFTTDMALIDGNLPQNEDGVTGSIFFRLEHPAGGEAYTRNGNFTLDGQGYLVNGQGLYVLNDAGQRIQLPNDDFRLDESGAIFVNNQQVARVGVSFAANPNMLQNKIMALFVQKMVRTCQQLMERMVFPLHYVKTFRRVKRRFWSHNDRFNDSLPCI